MLSFKIHRSEDRQFYFTLVARNGKVIMTSETYKRKLNSHIGIRAITRGMHRKSYKIIDCTL